MPNEIIETNSPTRVTNINARRSHSKGEKRVEIFRNGELFDAWLSEVQVGDCFATQDRPSLWLKCTSQPRIWSTQIDMQGLEVLQAKPMPLKDALPAPAPKAAPLLLDDVDDVEFKDVP